MSRGFIFFCLVCYFGIILGQESTQEDQQQQIQQEQASAPPPSTSLTNFSSDFSLSDGLLRAVGTVGVLITGIAGIAAILSYILPIFGFRSCMLFGNCDSGYETTGYNSAGMNSVYDQHGYSYQYGNKKRSLEYVGPILKMLTNAYEKYGPKPARNQQQLSQAKSSQQ